MKRTSVLALALLAAALPVGAQPHLDIVHAFAAPGPVRPLSTLVQATDGNFYGTTYDGGTADLGTVIRMTPSGTLTVMHPFIGQPDGAYPAAGLIQATLTRARIVRIK